jgi:hypothetical protein
MKSFTVTIPDSKANIFIEMMKSLNFVKKIQEVPDSVIPEKDKEIVLTRINKMEEDPESCINWEDIEQKMKL